MGRIVIPTDELRDHAGGYRSDSGELGDISLDLVGSWARRLPPPVDLIALGWQATQLHARIGLLAGRVCALATLLDIEALGAEFKDSASDIVRSLEFITGIGLAITSGVDQWRRFLPWPARMFLPVSAPFRKLQHQLSLIEDRLLASETVVVRREQLTGPSGAFGLVGFVPGAIISKSVSCWPPPDPSGRIAAMVEATLRLQPGDVAIHQVSVEPQRWVVYIRGVDGAENSSVNDVQDAMVGMNGRRSPHSEAVKEAMRLAGIPAGAEVLFVGHSQGGIAAMNLAADPSLPYRVTHVVTAGSPISHKIGGIPESTKTLSVENNKDWVPRLDELSGVSTAEALTTDNHLVATFTSPDGASLHGQTTYGTAIRDLEGTGRPGAFLDDAWSKYAHGGGTIPVQTFSLMDN